MQPPRGTSGTRHGHRPGKSFGAGVLIGLALITPVFAATRTEAFSMYEILLLVLAAVLFVSIALEAIVNGTHSPHEPGAGSVGDWSTEGWHDDPAHDGFRH